MSSVYIILYKSHNMYAPSHFQKNVQTDSELVYNIMQCGDGQNYTRHCSCCSGDKTRQYYVFLYRYIYASAAGIEQSTYNIIFIYIYIYMTTIIITIHYWMCTRFNPIWPLRKPPPLHHTQVHVACERGTLETTVIWFRA